MKIDKSPISVNTDLQEWIEALENVLLSDGKPFSEELLARVINEAKNLGLNINNSSLFPFKNSVSKDFELDYPGDLEKELRIRHLIRWNSLVMVLKANKTNDLGGHISTYSSASTLYEVGFNHFFRGGDNQLGDLVYFQGHSSPGVYARSFLEKRLSRDQLNNFRQEVDNNGLSSYPHPWLMPDYW